MELKWKRNKWDFNPTTAQLQTVGPTQFCVMDVHRGTLIGAVQVRIDNAFTAGAPTVSVGDDGDLTGLVAVADVTIGSEGLYNGTGPELCSKYDATASLANGKLYTTDDTIEINYTGDGSTTAGSLSVIVEYCEIE